MAFPVLNEVVTISREPGPGYIYWRADSDLETQTSNRFIQAFQAKLRRFLPNGGARHGDILTGPTQYYGSDLKARVEFPPVFNMIGPENPLYPKWGPFLGTDPWLFMRVGGWQYILKERINGKDTVVWTTGAVPNGGLGLYLGSIDGSFFGSAVFGGTHHEWATDLREGVWSHSVDPDGRDNFQLRVKEPSAVPGIAANDASVVAGITIGTANAPVYHGPLPDTKFETVEGYKWPWKRGYVRNSNFPAIIPRYGEFGSNYSPDLDGRIWKWTSTVLDHRYPDRRYYDGSPDPDRQFPVQWAMRSDGTYSGTWNQPAPSAFDQQDVYENNYIPLYPVQHDEVPFPEDMTRDKPEGYFGFRPVGRWPLQAKKTRFGNLFTFSNERRIAEPDRPPNGIDLFMDRPGVGIGPNDIYGRDAYHYLTKDGVPFDLRMKFHLVDSFDIWFAITYRIKEVVIGVVPGSSYGNIWQDDPTYTELSVYNTAPGRGFLTPVWKRIQNIVDHQWFQQGFNGCIRDLNVAPIVETSPRFDAENVFYKMDFWEWYGCLVVIDKPGLDNDSFSMNVYAKDESRSVETGRYNITSGRSPLNPVNLVLRVRSNNKFAPGLNAEYRGKKYRIIGVDDVEGGRYMLLTLGDANADTVVRFPTPSFAYTHIYGNAIPDPG